MYAQPEMDLQLWQGLELQVPVHKRFGIVLSDHWRLSLRGRGFERNAVECNFIYTPLKWTGIALAYRYSVFNNRNEHRLSLNWAMERRVKSLRTYFGLRLRGQWDLEARRGGNALPGLFTLRPRLFARYEPKGKGWKHWSFGLSVEPFFLLNTPRAGLDVLRFGLEANREIGAHSALFFRCFIDRQIGYERSDQNHILQMGLVAALDIPKKKKEKDPSKEKPDKKPPPKEEEEEEEEDEDDDKQEPEGKKKKKKKKTERVLPSIYVQ